MPRPKRSTELQTNRASQQRKITDSGLRTTKRRAKKSDEHHLKIAKQEILESPDRPNTLEEAPDKDEDILGMQSDSERKIYPDPDVDKRQKTRRLAGPRQIRIHQEDLSEQDILLRQFDLDYKFGPCVGLTRLERWERAEALGLNPPLDIKRIILANPNENESLFEGRV